MCCWRGCLAWRWPQTSSAVSGGALFLCGGHGGVLREQGCIECVEWVHVRMLWWMP